MNEIANIYNQLLKFESRIKQQEPYPIHKKLRFEEKDKNLVEWISNKIPFSKTDYILDAGCGTGYTLFYLNKKFGLKGVGISISPSEIEYAQKACEKEKLDPYLKFRIEDYQFYHAGPYSKIICIESLKHAENLKQSIGNLVDMLAEGGEMVIIDDFLVVENKELKKQKELWASPGFSDIEEYKKTLNSSGSFGCHIIDLTSYVHSRPVWLINILYLIFSTIKKIVSEKAVRNINTYLGGLILEKQYACKKVKYIAIIIEKTNSKI